MKKKKTLDKIYCGKIDISNGEVTICDPGINAGFWEKVILKIVPGEYDCFSYLLTNSYGTCVSKIQIVSTNNEYAQDKVKSGKSWRALRGCITVDSGLAGFFPKLEDFSSDDLWKKFVNWTYNEDTKNDAQTDSPQNTITTSVYEKMLQEAGYLTKYLPDDFPCSELFRNSFFSRSGVGDGVYTVCAIRDLDRKIVALEIRFAV